MEQMTFLQKIEPYLLSDDIIIQRFVLQALEDYPNVPAGWTERLLEEAMRYKGTDREREILRHLSNHTFNDRAAQLLLEMEKEDFLFAFAPEIAAKHKSELLQYLSEDDWYMYELMLHGTAEDIWDEYYFLIAYLEHKKGYDNTLFTAAKQMVRTLVQKGWMMESYIEDVLKKNEQQDYFSYEGIFAVYAISLMKLDAYIPFVASLLKRTEEDVLIREVERTLIAFQSDAVVRAVAPYAEEQDPSIFAAHVLANIKTPLALQKLREAFPKIKNDQDRAFFFESLCHHLSEEALPEIERYLEEGKFSSAIDVEQVAYSFYTVMGLTHPQLEEWKRVAYEKEEHYRQLLQRLLNYKNVPHRREEKKIGRNDPCPCGSGKKYKKCCGK